MLTLKNSIPSSIFDDRLTTNAIVFGAFVGLIIGLVLFWIIRSSSQRRALKLKWWHFFIPGVGAFLGGAGMVYGFIGLGFWFKDLFSLDRTPICVAIGCDGANVAAGPNYICRNDNVTVTWAPNTSLCSAANCQPRIPVPCVTAVDCGDPRQFCLDGACNWAYCAPGTCSSPLGVNQCTVSGTCVQPTYLTVRTGTAPLTAELPAADPRQSGSVSFTPTQSGSVNIDPGVPYWGQFSPVTIIETTVDQVLYADFVCQHEVPDWKYRLRIRGSGNQSLNEPAEVTVSDTVIMRTIQNESDRALLLRLPDGTGGFTEQTLPARDALGPLTVSNNAGEVLANDVSARIGECPAGSPPPATTAPSSHIPYGPPEEPVIPAILTLTCPTP